MSKSPSEERKYAPDLLLSESQEPKRPHGLARDKFPLGGVPASVPHTPDHGAHENPYAFQYRSDAPIWARYLKETQNEDEELVKQWQTGVDSLMVFTGLFAGIQTAFLVESQHGLQEDPQQALLEQILRALQNNTDISRSTSSQLSTSSLAVNYLWFTSLTLTLVSALALVLAKGCFTKYAPAFRGESSNDACLRHLRAMRFPQWHFGAFISGISLFIQVSLFMFFCGLVLFVLDRNTGIGYAIFGLVVTTSVLYLLMTILPLLFPACPFQTTISDFILGATSSSRYKKNYTLKGNAAFNTSGFQSHLPAHNMSFYKAIVFFPRMILSVFKAVSITWNATKQFLDEVGPQLSHEELEGKILSWIVVNSAQEETVEMAIKVMAGLPLSHLNKLKKAMHESEAVPIIRQKFQQCYQFPNVHMSQIEVYLHTLLQIVTMDVKSSAKLLPLLELGQPLYRWDNMDPCLQALAFCVRTEILLAMDKDDHQEEWTQTKNSLNCLSWMEVTPYLQKKIIEVMMRSLEGEALVLQKIASIVLAPIVDTEVFQTRNNIGQEKIIKHVIVLMANSDNTVQDSATEIFTKLNWQSAHSMLEGSTIDVIKEIQPRQGLQGGVRSAAFQLKRKQDIHIAFCDAVEKTISQVAPLLKNPNLAVQSDAVNILEALTKHIELHSSIKSITLEVIALLGDDALYILSAAMNALGMLAKPSPIKDTISVLVPQAFLLVENPEWHALWSAMDACVKFGQNTNDIYEVIRKYAPEVISWLKDIRWTTWWIGIVVIEKLAKQASSPELISNTIKQILTFLKDNIPDIWSDATNILGGLVKHAFHYAIKISVLNPIQMLNDPKWYTRLDGANALGMLTEHSAFHHSILEVLLLAKDDDPNVQLSAVNVLKKLATMDVALQHKVKEAVQDTLQLVNDIDNYWPEQSAAAIVALGKWAEDTAYHNMVIGVVPQVAQLVNRHNTVYAVAAVTALGSFIDHSIFHPLIKDAVSSTMELLDDFDWRIRRAAVDVLGKLADHDDFQVTVQHATPQAIMLLMDINSHVRYVAVQTLHKLGQKGFLSKSHGKRPQLQ